MTTSVFYADATYDGQIQSYATSYDGFTYYDAREGTGTSKTASASATTWRTGQYYILNAGEDDWYCWEYFTKFNTATIPDTNNVDSATFAAYLQGDLSTTDFTTEGRAIGDYGTLTATDWVPGSSVSGSYPLKCSISSSGIGSTGAFKNFSDAGDGLAGYINKTGNTFLLFTSSRFVAGNSPTGDEYLYWATADDGGAGTTNDPKLTVVHSSGSVDANVTPSALARAAVIPTPGVTATIGPHGSQSLTLGVP